MQRRCERIPMLTAGIGTSRELIFHRYGQAGRGPKAYLQAALHADETPGLLVLHHLIRLLDDAAAEGGILGEIVIAPYANPIGLDQQVYGYHFGRYHLGGGGNFNRNWLDLAEPAAEVLKGKLGADANANIATIRAVFRTMVEDHLANLAPDTLGAELIHYRLHLAREAVDADLVLDLHCDLEALMHLFLIPAHWPEGQDIAAELGCRAVLLAEDSGGASFDEAFSTPWTKLAQLFPKNPIPAACLSGTVELRGRSDVSDELAEADAPRPVPDPAAPRPRGRRPGAAAAGALRGHTAGRRRRPAHAGQGRADLQSCAGRIGPGGRPGGRDRRSRRRGPRQGAHSGARANGRPDPVAPRPVLRHPGHLDRKGRRR